MLERIRYLCELNGISLQKLEKILGVSNGSIAKSENMKCDRLKMIADYFHVTMEWLMGSGDIAWNPKVQDIFVTSDIMSNDEYALIEKWRSADELQKEMVRRILSYGGDNK